MTYWAALYVAGLPSLTNRRDKICRKFFQKMRDPSSYYLPLVTTPRDPELTLLAQNCIHIS